MDKLKAMQIFVTITHTGSLTAAAKHLDLSLTTIVRILATLEADVGVRLIHRTTRRIILSEEGKKYVEQCRLVLKAVDEADEMLSNLQSKPSGSLSITAPVLFGRIHVLPLVSEFMALYPEVDIELLLVDDEVDLLGEGVDVALRIGFPQDSSIVATKVGNIHNVICVSPEYLSQHDKPRHPTDLVSKDCVQFAGVTPNNVWLFQDGHNECKIEVKYKLRTNDGYAALHACRKGLGYCAFFDYQVHEQIKNGKLERVLRGFEPASFPVNLLYPSTRLMSVRLRAFLDWVKPRLRDRLT